jgi:tripartite-type tricarboxylate transporter receptor subunit TctC
VVADYDMVSTNKASGFKGIKDVVAYAKANPGKLRWGTTGARTPNMVNTLWILENLGIGDLVTLVPQDGGAAGRTALLGNHVQVLTSSFGDVRASVTSGDIAPLMVINDQPVGLLPGVPTTIQEGCQATTFIPRAVFAPPGTDAAKVRILEAAVKACTEDPQFRSDIQNLGIDVRFVGRDEGSRLISKWYGDFEPRFKRLP